MALGVPLVFFLSPFQPVPSVFKGILAGLFRVFLVVVFGVLDLVFNGGFFGSFSVGSVSFFLSLSNYF